MDLNKFSCCVCLCNNSEYEATVTIGREIANAVKADVTVMRNIHNAVMAKPGEYVDKYVIVLFPGADAGNAELNELTARCINLGIKAVEYEGYSIRPFADI